MAILWRGHGGTSVNQFGGQCDLSTKKWWEFRKGWYCKRWVDLNFLTGKIAWTLWTEYQRDNVRGTKILRMTSCTWHKQLDTWHQGWACFMDYFGDWGKVSSAMCGDQDKEQWLEVWDDFSRELLACLWLFLLLLQLHSWHCHKNREYW